jgi:hypothetical protein
MVFQIIACPSCGYENNGQARFCNKCATLLVQQDLAANKQPKSQPPSRHNIVPGDTSKNLLEHAKKLIDEGKVRESEVIFKQVIASGQNTSEGFYGLGYVRKNLGDLHGAATQFENALQEDPKNANALYQLGWIAEKQQSWEAASAFYGRALSIYPEHKGAIAALKRLPDNPASHNSLDHHEPNVVSNVTLPPPHGVAPPTIGGTLPTKDGADPYAYGIYGAVLQESLPTSKSTIALIDDLRMIDIHPRFSAYLGRLLGPLFLMLSFGIGALLSAPILAHIVPQSNIPFLMLSSGIGGLLSAPILAHIVPQSINPFIAQSNIPYGLLVTGLLIVFSMLCLIRLIMDCLYIASIRMTIDKGRVQKTSGYLGTESWSEELSRVSTIDIKRTLLNRLTGDGSLIFTFDHREAAKFLGLVKAHAPDIPPMTDSHRGAIEFLGLVKGNRLHETRQQLLNLVGLLHANAALKGIIQ